MAFSRFIRFLFLAMLMIASSTMITHKALVDADTKHRKLQGRRPMPSPPPPPIEEDRDGHY
ncbi:hypothetical protein NC651_028434 [Populus alba x Populus x berolinensis]|nr:hypothetical protein NC651_028434 [Populus alba x Populus x berolinensis]